MNTLIIGAEGQLGRELLKVLPDAYGTAHSGKNSLDVTNAREVSDYIEIHKPEIIINSSAFTNVDSCEVDKQSALQTNGYAVRNILKGAKRIGSYFVQISTDYVFDGNSGNYTEQSIPNPINYYGLSKLVGDVFAQCYDLSLIVRTSGVFGNSNNFPRFAYNTLMKGCELNVIESFYSPIHAKLLAESIKHLIESKTLGLINVAGERISRLELASDIAELFKFDKTLIKENSFNIKLNARRPRDSSLDISKAKSLIPIDFFTIENSLKLLSK